MDSTSPRLGLSVPAAPVPVRVAARERHRPWLICAALSLLWFALTAGLRPLAIPDEGRYAGVAWEMLRSGQWLVPTLNGQPFFHKPPLFYWLTAASMDVFGVGVWSARLASMLAATAATTALYGFVRRWAGPRPARASAVVLATMPLFYGGAQYANMDMLVAACITLAILLGAHALLAREHGQAWRVALAGAFAAVAAGVLAKGLIGVVLPALVLLGWAAATRRTRAALRALCWPAGWLVLLAIGAPWFSAMQWRFPGFGHYFVVVQHLQRFAAGGFNNPQPAWFYAAVLGLGTLPWSPWLWRAWQRRAQPPGLERDLRTLMLVWLVIVVGFFSVPDSKLIGYILPALAPLAFLVATRLGKGAGTTAVLSATLCLTLPIAAHFYQPKSLAPLAQRLLLERAPGDAVAFVAGYPYDVPFYARLDAPVLVVDDWSAAELQHDSWRRELADTEAFAAPGHTPRLLHPDEFAGALCGGGSTWIVAPWPAIASVPWLVGREPVEREGDRALWRVDAREPSVAGVCARGAIAAR